jgi:hypothetical protein
MRLDVLVHRLLRAFARTRELVVGISGRLIESVRGRVDEQGARMVTLPKLLGA